MRDRPLFQMAENDGFQADEKIEHTFGGDIRLLNTPSIGGGGSSNQVQTPAEDKYIAFCSSWARQFTLIPQCLSPPSCINWYRQKGLEILIAASHYSWFSRDVRKNLN